MHVYSSGCRPKSSRQFRRRIVSSTVNRPKPPILVVARLGHRAKRQRRRAPRRAVRMPLWIAGPRLPGRSTTKVVTWWPDSQSNGGHAGFTPYNHFQTFIDLHNRWFRGATSPLECEYRALRSERLSWQVDRFARMHLVQSLDAPSLDLRCDAFTLLACSGIVRSGSGGRALVVGRKSTVARMAARAGTKAHVVALPPSERASGH